MLKRALPVVSAVLGFVFLLIVSLACGGGPGGTLCDQPVAPPHATASGCTLVCDPGWYNCDTNVQNGCETNEPCSNKPVDGSTLPTTKGPQLIATLSGAPHGIAACGTNVFYLDDNSLSTPAGSVFALTRTPAGGLACKGSDLFFATSSDGTANANGSLWRYTIGSTAPVEIATGIDPGRGVDVRGSIAYWLARSTDAGTSLARTTGDGGFTSVVPADETSTYKSFALLDDGDYAISAGSIWRSDLDGGTSTLAFDASAARALLKGTGVQAPYAIVTANAGDLLVATNDASTPVVPFPTIVATAQNGADVIIATDDTIFYVNVNVNVPKIIAKPFLHITDVTLDGTYAYWLTSGAGATPGAVWKAPLK
jgi:hypothetical protein